MIHLTIGSNRTLSDHWTFHFTSQKPRSETLMKDGLRDGENQRLVWKGEEDEGGMEERLERNSPILSELICACVHWEQWCLPKTKPVLVTRLLTRALWGVCVCVLQ
jgi:hypothetical protein